MHVERLGGHWRGAHELALGRGHALCEPVARKKSALYLQSQSPSKAIHHMKGDSDVEVRPEDQTRINEFGRNNVRGVSRATRAARRAHASLSQARMHELREDIAGFQKARSPNAAGRPARARARARRATIERSTPTRSARIRVASLGWTPRSHALHPRAETRGAGRRDDRGARAIAPWACQRAEP